MAYVSQLVHEKAAKPLITKMKRIGFRLVVDEKRKMGRLLTFRVDGVFAPPPGSRKRTARIVKTRD